MGRPKALLPFGPETMLGRVVRLLSEAVGPIVVVAAEGQDVPPVSGQLLLAHDRHPDRGPLEGIAAGLAALGSRAEAAYVTSCDVPLLRPAFVRRVIELSHGYDAAVPYLDGRDEPLAAVYRLDVLPRIEALLVADRRRPVFLFDEVRTRRIVPEELLDVDPLLDSLANLNTPEAYQEALQRAGLEA